MVELVCIDPARVKEFWPHASHFIRAAIQRTRLSRFEDTEREVLSGLQLLWLAWNGEQIEAAATTQLADGACIITACGGRDRKRWLQLLDQIEDFARAENCTCVRIYGRRGWARALENYDVRHVILERSL